MFFCIFAKQKDVMTQFNFDKLTQRRGTNSYKWDETDDPFITSEMLYRLSYTSTDKRFIKR